MAKLLHIILELRHDTISQIAARKLSRSHQLGTQAPALLLITEARRIIRREQHAAITSLGGTGALSLHTQNRANHLPQLFKPCILPPWSGFEGGFATVNDGFATVRRFCLFLFYLFRLNL
jgi:hypothetical protein